jgi:hypothetical protein
MDLSCQDRSGVIVIVLIIFVQLEKQLPLVQLTVLVIMVLVMLEKRVPLALQTVEEGPVDEVLLGHHRLLFVET